MAKSVSHKNFITNLKKRNHHYKNGDIDILNDYTKSRNKLLVSTEYGICEIYPSDLLRGSKPNIKSSIDRNKYIIKQFNKIHENKYIYTLVKYINNRKKVKIICPKHGKFEQIPDSHIRGQGCPICAKEINSFKLSDWKKMGGSNPGIFYILRCWNDEEEFYKVGITAQGSVKNRYKGSDLPYNYEIVKQIVDEDRERIWKLEKEYLSLLSEFRYEPLIKFKGSQNECFKIINK